MWLLVVAGLSLQATPALADTDTTPPDVAIQQPAAGSAHTGSVHVQAQASDNDAVARVDFELVRPTGAVAVTASDPTAPYDATLSLTGLPDGDYVLRARAVDASSVAREVAVSITVDQTGPSITLDGPGVLAGTPPWYPGTDPLTWTFSVSDPRGVGTVACRIDSVTDDCTGPTSHTWDDPDPGSGHTMTVIATDSLGNTGTRTRRLSIDDTAPFIILTGIEEGETIANPRPLRAIERGDHESGLVGGTCHYDDMTDDDCNGPLPDGEHTITATATNDAGMTTTVTRNFFIDATAPITTITSGPPRPFAVSSAAAFGLASNDAMAEFRCKLDARSFADCGTSVAYADLRAGTHTFTAKARDELGNADSTPETWTWTVPHDDRAMSSREGWSRVTKGSFWRDSALRAIQRGATLVRDDVQTRRLAVMATTCSGCGTVDVFHGKERVKRLSLDSPTTTHRRLFTVKTYDWLSRAKDLRIVVVSSGKRVLIDGVGIATR